jgi:hypothetical protein
MEGKPAGSHGLFGIVFLYLCKTCLIMKDPTGLKKLSADIAYHTILNTLKQVGNNKTKAAKILNVDRKTIYNKLRHYQKIAPLPQAGEQEINAA